jgi:uncharacterized protein (TIGR03382 family)
VRATPDADGVRLVVALLVVLAACQQKDPQLSSTGQELTSMAVTSHDFGSLQVGQMSGAYTFTINPAAGNNYDTVTSITENCPDFSVNAPGLPADVYRDCETCTCPASNPQLCPAVCCTLDLQSYSFDTYFSPTVSATVSCTVTISLNNGATTRLVTLTGTGTPPPIQMNVQPTSANFGDVRRNTDSTGIGINVSNTGGQAISVSSVTVSPGFAIASGPTGAYNLGVGATQPYSVICHPTATGPISGSFKVTSSAPQVVVPLSCNGIDSNLTINPSPETMPDTRIGEPIQGTITLTNSGGAPMQLENVAVTGQDLTMATGPGTMSLAANGGSTTVTVGFSAASKETATGQLTVTYDGGQQRTSSISAKALSTSMAVTPDGDIDFGPVCSGQTAPPKKFTIIANDEGPFKVNTITTPDAPFIVMGAPALPAAVQGNDGNEVTFMVTAAPTTAGQQVSTMMVDTDIPGGTPHMINLSVNGLSAGVSATPDSIDFGSNPIDSATIGQQVELSNCATAPVTASNARIEGKDAADFAIVQQPDSAMIQPTNSASWLVVLQAHTAGPKEASFLVDYDGGTAMVPLAGEGLGDMTGSGGPGGEKSYYSCAVGGAGGSWPLVLAFAALLRRRRRAGR